MAKPTPIVNLSGTQVAVPKGPGSFIGKSFRTLVTAALNIVFNWKFQVRYYDGTGNYLGTKEAITVMGANGAVTTLPPMGLPGGGGSGGGFMGEYDPTKSYAAGETFLVSTAQTIASILVIAGYYGVPPATVADVNGLPWAGFVPANPTGNAVPQSPLPSLGAAPNNVFYAKLIMPSC